MYARWHVPSASATPWDGADDSSLAPAQRLVMGWQREQYERLHELGGELDAAFLNAYERESCAWWCGRLSRPRCRFGSSRAPASAGSPGCS